MKIVSHLDQIPPISGPISLTIGVYDGVHLGHQLIFKELHRQTRKRGTRVILTFSDHPTTLFTPESPMPLITALEQRLHLLDSFGFDLAIVLPFNQALTRLTYDTFIKNLHAKLPFTHLTLGSDARFGRARAGDPPAIHELGRELNYTAHYLSKESYHREPISSGRIRKLLAEGDLKRVKKMLGRPYSIRLPFIEPIRENEIQHRLEFTREGLCTLPSAVYAVDIGKVPAIAFYKATNDATGRTKFSCALYFEQSLPKTTHLTLNFISYLHNELDPELSQSASLLENLNPQPSLHLSPDLSKSYAACFSRRQKSLEEGFYTFLRNRCERFSDSWLEMQASLS
ncbi:MAG: Riboflavin biosynthesis protein RibF [Chlamydiae bacterium]|nr:Riboflavin biosynthesis protein RibF [Chlamydiota bacterium]